MLGRFLILLFLLEFVVFPCVAGGEVCDQTLLPPVVLHASVMIEDIERGTNREYEIENYYDGRELAAVVRHNGVSLVIYYDLPAKRPRYWHVGDEHFIEYYEHEELGQMGTWFFPCFHLVLFSAYCDGVLRKDRILSLSREGNQQVVEFRFALPPAGRIGTKRYDISPDNSVRRVETTVGGLSQGETTKVVQVVEVESFLEGSFSYLPRELILSQFGPNQGEMELEFIAHSVVSGVEPYKKQGGLEAFAESLAEKEEAKEVFSTTPQQFPTQKELYKVQGFSGFLKRNALLVTLLLGAAFALIAYFAFPFLFKES